MSEKPTSSRRDARRNLLGDVDTIGFEPPEKCASERERNYSLHPHRPSNGRMLYFGRLVPVFSAGRTRRLTLTFKSDDVNISIDTPFMREYHGGRIVRRGSSEPDIVKYSVVLASPFCAGIFPGEV